MVIASSDVAFLTYLPTNEASINATIQILHKSPEGSQDLEALENVNRTIYAISENKNNLGGTINLTL